MAVTTLVGVDYSPPVNLDGAEPIAAYERTVNDQHQAPPLNITPDVSWMAGGTAVMPPAHGIGDGEYPAPWNPPVAHHDRAAGALREAIAELLEDG